LDWVSNIYRDVQKIEGPISQCLPNEMAPDFIFIISFNSDFQLLMMSNLMYFTSSNNELVIIGPFRIFS
jgi:ABC-type Fe3+-hydroxamate transport system substrate-binding protein